MPESLLLDKQAFSRLGQGKVLQAEGHHMQTAGVREYRAWKDGGVEPPGEGGRVGKEVKRQVREAQSCGQKVGLSSVGSGQEGLPQATSAI